MSDELSDNMTETLWNRDAFGESTIMFYCKTGYIFGRSSNKRTSNIFVRLGDNITFRFDPTQRTLYLQKVRTVRYISLQVLVSYRYESYRYHVVLLAMIKLFLEWRQSNSYWTKYNKWSILSSRNILQTSRSLLINKLELPDQNCSLTGSIKLIFAYIYLLIHNFLIFKTQAVRTFLVLVPHAITQLLTISANNSAKIPVAIPRTIFNPFLIPESSITCPTSKFSKALLNINTWMDSLDSRLWNLGWVCFLLPGQIFNDWFQINSV